MLHVLVVLRSPAATLRQRHCSARSAWKPLLTSKQAPSRTSASHSPRFGSRDGISQILVSVHHMFLNVGRVWNHQTVPYFTSTVNGKHIYENHTPDARTVIVVVGAIRQPLQFHAFSENGVPASCGIRFEKSKKRSRINACSASFVFVRLPHFLLQGAALPALWATPGRTFAKYALWGAG